MSKRETGSSSSQRHRRVIAAATVGTVLEWYDFALYASLAAVLSRQFFPADDRITSLLILLATYGVGFVFRPLGALVLGHYGDRLGRRTMLAVSMLMMGAGSLAIGLLPTYSQVGVLAPVLLVFFRIWQGFAAGAEWSGGSIFLVEHAPEGRRSLFGSIQQAATNMGFLAGSGLAALLVAVMSDGAIDQVGWRIGFWIGGAAAVVGLLIRFRLEETPEFVRLRERPGYEAPRMTDTLRTNVRSGLLVSGIVVGITLLAYTITSFPAYLEGVGGVSLSTALTTNTIALSVEVVLIVVFGALADRYGKLQVMIVAALLTAAVTYPAFLLLEVGTFAALVAGQCIFAVLFAAASAPQAALYAEIIPTRVRTTVLSTYYNLTVAVFGGTVPFVNVFLADATGSSRATSIYLIIGSLVTAAALVIAGRHFIGWGTRSERRSSGVLRQAEVGLGE